MPESYFQLSARDQAAALAAGAAASGRPPHLLEKDIWVVWSRSTLFKSELGAHLVFRGGTALSKAYKVIHRFSPRWATIYSKSQTDGGRGLVENLPMSEVQGAYPQRDVLDV